MLLTYLTYTQPSLEIGPYFVIWTTLCLAYFPIAIAKTFLNLLYMSQPNLGIQEGIVN